MTEQLDELRQRLFHMVTAIDNAAAQFVTSQELRNVRELLIKKKSHSITLEIFNIPISDLYIEQFNALLNTAEETLATHGITLAIPQNNNQIAQEQLIISETARPPSLWQQFIALFSFRSNRIYISDNNEELDAFDPEIAEAFAHQNLDGSGFMW